MDIIISIVISVLCVFLFAVGYSNLTDRFILKNDTAIPIVMGLVCNRLTGCIYISASLIALAITWT